VKVNGNQQGQISKENRKRSLRQSGKTVSVMILYGLNKMANIQMSLLYIKITTLIFLNIPQTYSKHFQISEAVGCDSSFL